MHIYQPLNYKITLNQKYFSFQICRICWKFVEMMSLRLIYGNDVTDRQDSVFSVKGFMM